MIEHRLNCFIVNNLAAHAQGVSIVAFSVICMLYELFYRHMGNCFYVVNLISHAPRTDYLSYREPAQNVGNVRASISEIYYLNSL